jgi:NADH dehydrogenase FAD-containing subunit
VDCSCPPTAQAASQQGKYLGSLFRDEIVNPKFNPTESGVKGGQDSPRTTYTKQPFKYVNYGALAYVGNSRGVAELKAIWDLPPFNVMNKHTATQRQTNVIADPHKNTTTTTTTTVTTTTTAPSKPALISGTLSDSTAPEIVVMMYRQAPEHLRFGDRYILVNL